MPISVLVWARSFIEPDFFENNVPFDNTTQIFLINLLEIRVRIWVRLRLHYFSICH